VDSYLYLVASDGFVFGLLVLLVVQGPAIKYKFGLNS